MVGTVEHRRVGFIPASIVGVWALYVLLVALRTSVIEFPHKVELVERHVVVAAIGAALTLGLHLALKRVPRRGVRLRLAAALIFAAAPAGLLATLNYDVMFVFDPAELWSAGYRASVSLPVITAQTITENYFIFASWAMMTTAVEAVIGEAEASRRATLAALEAQQAQLRALRYQLDPHFLFNALNTISALVMREDADRAERAISALSEFLRVTLAMNPSAEVTLDRDVHLQRLYLAIEEIRFGARLHVEIAVAEEVKGAQVPPLLLQPLVENVVRHALAQTSAPVRLELQAHSVGERLHLVVQDDGPGRSDTSGGGIGLRNVESRLALLYGAEGRLEHGPRQDRGYRAQITLPLRATPA